MKLVKARKDEISGQSRTGLERSLDELRNCTVYRGHARFESPSQLAVGAYRLTAEKIFINVGGRAAMPDITGISSIPTLSNSRMMALDTLPRHLVIVGGSYIGLEFGQMFRRFGSEVTILEKGPRVIPREDEDVSSAIQEVLSNEGVRVSLNVSPKDLAGYPVRLAPTVASLPRGFPCQIKCATAGTNSRIAKKEGCRIKCADPVEAGLT